MALVKEREERNVSQRLNFTPIICAESLHCSYTVPESVSVTFPEEHPKKEHNIAYHPLDTDTET